jgi:uncharacterized membrane protein YhaH (DUF805 family)
MTFTAAIRSAFSNYAVFEGRATRSEYWWFYLFAIIINAVLNVAAELSGDSDFVASLVTLAISLAIVVPSIAVAARRLHDVNRSGWWQLIALTIIGIIPLIYWLAKKGTDGPNRFGEDRLAALSATETPSIVT